MSPERPARLPLPPVGDPEREALERDLKGARGRVPTPFKVWMESPPLARLLQPLGAFLAGASSLSKAEAEIAILFIARRWHADYVLAVHAREAEEAGVSEAEIAALRAGHLPDPDDRRLRCLCRVLSSLAADGRPDDSVFDEAVQALGHKGVAELLALAGYFTSVSLAMKFYDVQPPGR